MSRKMPAVGDVRAERDMIETTRGPSINWPADHYRTWTPGPWRYYEVHADGTETAITEAEYRAALADAPTCVGCGAVIDGNDRGGRVAIRCDVCEELDNQ